MLPVSVIIPARNEASNIARLIRSLWEQTPPPAEILVIDAGSTDETGDIARRMGCRVLRVDRAYPGQARNIGAEQARQEILAFWDASMWVAPGCLQALVEPLVEGRADVVQGHLEVKPMTTASLLSFLVLQPPYTHKVENRFFYAPPVACTALRKQLWVQAGPFQPWRAREDSDFRKRVEACRPRVLFQPSAVTYWEPAETWRTMLRKVRLYGRHNLLSGKPGEWYGGLLRVYSFYLGLSLFIAFLYGIAWGVAGFMTTSLAGAALRTVRKALRYRAYFLANHSIETLALSLLCKAMLFLLATDIASWVGAMEWLYKDFLRRDPEPFRRPTLLEEGPESRTLAGA